jgi:hypothetical protein
MASGFGHMSARTETGRAEGAIGVMADDLPMADMTDEVPMAEMADEMPMAGVADNLPMADTTDEVPMAEMADELPMAGMAIQDLTAIASSAISPTRAYHEETSSNAAEGNASYRQMLKDSTLCTVCLLNMPNIVV